MKIKLFFFFIIFCCYGCTKVQPRRPIDFKSSSTILKETLKKSIQLNRIEDDKITALIKKDTTNSYQVSPNGFWYAYINKKEAIVQTPKLGDEVTFEYNITDLEGNIIYSKEELGIMKYRIDKEDFIFALQLGIKLMKVGETIIFVIPSYNAFGISGDGEKIGINQSIKSTVTLLNIK
ncbi:MAG: gliding motility-associated peptidyl-prolyl isomerase GldI [Polaribacter sp.]|jgi:FKBP-type peptidyl-prolyl cis-trans isomerase FkpA|nr:gliding motility-associated peptidyl-prolyl isomerase GldI [Polaribacter sp.]